MDSEQFALNLGKLVANLLGMEILLRYALQKQKLPRSREESLNCNLYGIMNVNPLTSYDSLKYLIHKYNKLVAEDYQVDESVVKLEMLLPMVEYSRIL